MNYRNQVLNCLGVLALLLLSACAAPQPRANQSEPMVLVVMDPLAKELACACVQGFGQRDYRKVAGRLKAALGREVAIEFSDDLAQTLSFVGTGREVVVIGEPSRVTHGAKAAELKAHAVCELTDLEGETTLKGLFVARANDPAKSLKDLTGRKIFMGLEESDAKHAAAMAALKAAELKEPAETVSRPEGNDAALDVVDSTASPAPVAVIPSYALRLMEGCGSITPGDLKVIGTTAPSPFITVFISDNIAAKTEETILSTLLGFSSDAQMLKDIESRDGFRALNRKTSGAPATAGGADWPDWRGPGRDGRVSKLPSQLPPSAKIVWKKAAMPGGLAGLSVGGGKLILAERDFGDESDVYRCLNADSGELIWRIEFPAPGQLDYGQNPRATPVIRGERAYLLGAFGDLRCVNMADGSTVWSRNLVRDFHAELPTWGMCSTPLVVDGMLIVNPGASEASLAALDCKTGRTRWTTPGNPAAYAAFIVGEFGGRRQVVGYDDRSLGGWDVKTGKRLWTLVPLTKGDFNVPTPIAVEGGIVVATENNGTRLYRFDDAGRIIPQPVGSFAGVSPDTATPVVSNGRLFAVHLGMHCLDLKNGLKPVWQTEIETLGDYGTVIADDARVLLVTLGGELILLDAKADTYTVVSRQTVFEDDVEVYSHPALAGTRLYIRGGSHVVCVELGTD